MNRGKSSVGTPLADYYLALAANCVCDKGRIDLANRNASKFSRLRIFSRFVLPGMCGPAQADVPNVCYPAYRLQWLTPSAPRATSPLQRNPRIPVLFAAYIRRILDVGISANNTILSNGFP
ncbi:hypothetical protein AAHK20_14985 [Trinickia sp. YCB016]